ncbi:1510_t:CDS:2, partial [Racocetra persica]
VYKFKKQNKLQNYQLYGEANSALMEILSEQRIKFREIIKEYSLENIFNADETGLFFWMALHQTLLSQPQSGWKKVFIVHYNSNESNENNDEYNDSNEDVSESDEELNSEEEELESENSDNKDSHASSSKNSTRRGHGHPRLSASNINKQSRAHPYRLPEPSETPLTNIRLEFLPPHTTAHLQPMDAA